MTTMTLADLEARAVRLVARRAHRLSGRSDDFDALLERVGDAHLVLLGGASLGTHEFYRIRAEITKRLIREKGFVGVLVEADWTDAYRVNRFVRGVGDDGDAADALRDFTQFPQWMWRNADVLDFVGWLRTHNDAHVPDRRVGFYGLDHFSLHASTAAVLKYLRRVDPDAAGQAAARYACFDQFGPELQEYGHATALGMTASREKEVVDQLVELYGAAGDYARRLGASERDATVAVQQTGRVVRDVEQYYRTMMQGGPAAWNLRDAHMADTLDALFAFLGANSSGATRPKLVIWAHNSHIGSARWTEMSSMGELNLGQLVRENHGKDAVLVGFTTYSGTVTAASQWDGIAERKVVPPALPGSYEMLFHSSALGNLLLVPDHDDPADEELILTLDEPFLERAIGVIYRPTTERLSHYFMARLPRQFDAVIHYDVTRAVEPLEGVAVLDSRQMSETDPTALCRCDAV